ncbi:hypothetical protein OG250_04215 [Streptomyces sp. NBC_00487]|uniref:hypothetical protein n=1 Tax=unclassified Streptomyces TaxID=2593676 RepID=UPI002E175082|nr:MULTISPECIES: hypothetical protein [unclassified Streptomyces]
MSELLWDEVKGFFDPEWEGCLPDVWVGSAVPSRTRSPTNGEHLPMCGVTSGIRPCSKRVARAERRR